MSAYCSIPWKLDLTPEPVAHQRWGFAQHSSSAKGFTAVSVNSVTRSQIGGRPRMDGWMDRPMDTIENYNNNFLVSSAGNR
ncbi:hypothetical protein AMECASPLE_026868 [Ameca splendens]|uniref:Uncharacterized protein n=1 Tax=Ameca splendens TaxID=208324 RepID=A0ABV0ZPW0_9TELE